MNDSVLDKGHTLQMHLSESPAICSIESLVEFLGAKTMFPAWAIWRRIARLMLT